MKLKNDLGLLVAGFLLIFFPGCYEKNYTVKTNVNPDGSFERSFIVDSSSIYENPFPFVFDSTWQIEVRKANDTSKTFIYSAKKYFSDSEDLQKEIVNSNKLNKLNITAKIEKQFRWFYTYFSYQEIYKENIPFNYVPFEKYFSEKEIKQISADSVNEQLKHKQEEWIARNIFEEYFNVLLIGATKINDSTFTPDLLNSKKELLFKTLIAGDSKPEEMLSICENVLRTKAVWKFKDEFVEQEKSLTNKFELMMELDGNYNNEIILPGIIIGTNAKAVEGNKLSWKFGKSGFLYIEMTAQSRMINIWAFIVTGILILFILIGLAFPILRRKRSLL